jgi:alkanesulfonate monooxygenase SsuD/methylene tetrahydromethanopterin reductase-like flavin-dependent oxidoreductase (luciferase family)
MLQLVPTVPASPVERERLRPIAHRTEKIQQMLDEMVDLAQLVEELGFTAVTYSEHHFYTEGLEAGATPTPHLLHLLIQDETHQGWTGGVCPAYLGPDPAG